MEHALALGRRYGASWWHRTKPISLQGALNQHLLCLGQPGSGKTTCLYYQAEQDVREHRGFILLNPHPDLTQRVLHSLIAHHWAPEDVICLDPASNRTYGSPILNVFEYDDTIERYEVTDELLSAVKAIFAESWGERTADLYRNTFSALQDAGLTLSDAPLFLSDSAFRNAVVSHLTNADVKLFWERHFNELKPYEQKTYIESPRNKLSAFLSSPYLKPVFSGVQSTLRFDHIMNEGKACLINLSQNHLKESRKLFGALVLAKIALAILSREHLPPEERRPCTLYCDEHHEYFLPQFCLLIAAGARKYGISYRIFSQSLSQYHSADVDILLATCATQVAFNLARKDAERLAKELFTFSGNRFVKYQDRDLWGPKGRPAYYSISEEFEHAVNELTTQQVGECLIRVRGPADTGDPYVATVPAVPYTTVDPQVEEAFCQASAAHYCRPLAQIEADRRQRLARWLSPPSQNITNRS